jgi:hypothetical protein
MRAEIFAKVVLFLKITHFFSIFLSFSYSSDGSNGNADELMNWNGAKKRGLGI